MNKVYSSMIEVAQDTLSICERGTYQIPTGEKFDISSQIEHSKSHTLMYFGSALGNTAKSVPEGKNFLPMKRGLYGVTNRSTLDAAQHWTQIAPEMKIAILNFASAKHPGGGFLRGATTQEESIAYCSSLYVSLLTCQDSYYTPNIAHPNKSLYTDNIIWTPDAVVFRDFNTLQLIPPYTVNIITCAAPNAGVARRQGVKNSEIQKSMSARIQKILEVALLNDVDILILGAFGCGVFKNNPEYVSRAFNNHLIYGGYSRRFHQLDFPIPGGKNLEVFKQNLTRHP